MPRKASLPAVSHIWILTRSALGDEEEEAEAEAGEEDLVVDWEEVEAVRGMVTDPNSTPTVGSASSARKRSSVILRERA